MRMRSHACLKDRNFSVRLGAHGVKTASGRTGNAKGTCYGYEDGFSVLYSV